MNPHGAAGKLHKSGTGCQSQGTKLDVMLCMPDMIRSNYLQSHDYSLNLTTKLTGAVRSGRVRLSAGLGALV
jgi:hypothetical protein